MEREATVTTSVGSDTLTNFPTDMQSPISLRVYSPEGNSISLPYMEYEEFDRAIPNETSSGYSSPSLWRVFNKGIIIYPIADAIYTLKLKYIVKTFELSGDTAVPEIPEEFGELLVLSAYKRALEFNDENDKAQLIQLQIDEQINKMDERYKRQSGMPHIMLQPNRRNRIKGF
jgi:hypothetical protein